MSPAGCILPFSGLESTALRPSGGNMQPLGDIISVFAVSQFYWLPGSHLSWLVLSEYAVLPGEREGSRELILD